MLITWDQGFLILIENVLWLNLETFMWLNGFLPMIENVLWLEVKTLTRIIKNVLWLITFCLILEVKEWIWLRIVIFNLECTLVKFTMINLQISCFYWEFTLI